MELGYLLSSLGFIYLVSFSVVEILKLFYMPGFPVRSAASHVLPRWTNNKDSLWFWKWPKLWKEPILSKLCLYLPCISIHQTLILEEEGITGLSSSYDKNLPGFAVVNGAHFVFQLLTITMEKRGYMTREVEYWLHGLNLYLFTHRRDKHDLMMAMSQLETKRYLIIKVYKLTISKYYHASWR